MLAEKYTPDVLILLAAYNGNQFIREQIDSIIKQDLANWKLVLSDDGEKTSEILREYADRFPERIIHYRSGRRFGSAKAHFMHLLQRFGDEAPYVMFSDQDDVWEKNKIRKTLAAMKEEEANFDGPILVHTDLRVVDCSLKEISPSFFLYSQLGKHRHTPAQLLIQSNVSGCTAMLNRKLTMLSVRRVDTDKILMHDHWTALIAAFFGRIIFVDEPTILYRQHTSNSCGVKSLLSPAYIVSALRRSNYRQLSIQAAAFLECYGDMINKKDAQLLRAVISLKTNNKLLRVFTYFRFGLWKSPLLRQIGQIVFW